MDKIAVIKEINNSLSSIADRAYEFKGETQSLTVPPLLLNYTLVGQGDLVMVITKINDLFDLQLQTNEKSTLHQNYTIHNLIREDFMQVQEYLNANLV